MISIKKVEVTPLDRNYASVVDSTQTLDDKTKNTYSMRVIDGKISDLNDGLDGLDTAKADKSTTYTKTQTDNLFGAKADKSTTYTKTECDTKYKLKGDFAVITGTISVENADGSAFVNYPSGFNGSNCVVVSTGIGYSSSISYYTYGTDNVKSTGAYLANDRIAVWCEPVSSAGPTGNLPFKLVLMKVS